MKSKVIPFRGSEDNPKDRLAQDAEEFANIQDNLGLLTQKSSGLINLKTRFQRLPDRLKEAPASVAHVVAALQVIMERLDQIGLQITNEREAGIVTATHVRVDEAVPGDEDNW